MMPLQRHLKNVVHNYTEAERKVREATSNDPWGPSSTLMSDIADKTYNVISFTEIMQMIWKRLNDKSKNWRHVYKSLILLEYIIKTGSEKVALQCRENIHAIETLMDFYHVEDNKDVGNRVREKARMLNALLRDEERLQEERTKALLARERLMLGGGGGGGGGGSQLGVTPGEGRSSYTGFSPQASGRAGRSSVQMRSSSQPSLTGAMGDFDSALPASYGEEQLQLQLALAISKEEHEKETQKRQEEEAKEALKLQMVLEQSKRDEQRRSAGALADQSNILATTAPSSISNGGGNLFNLIDTSLSLAPANLPDPWSPIVPSPNNVPAALLPPPPSAQPVVAGPSHSPSLVPFTNNSKVGAGELSILDEAWIPKDPAPARPMADGNPWATLDPLKASFPSTSIAYNNANGQYQMNNNTNDDLQISNASRKRTPADFLGDHKDLVDLEKLVDRNPSPANATISWETDTASTNPFATGTRTPSLQSTNPFNANLPPKPSLNQLTSGIASPPMPALPAASLFQHPSAFACPPPRQPFAAALYGDPFTQPPSQPPQAQKSSLNPFF